MNSFFAALYEFWGGATLGDFTSDMYSSDLYLPVGLTMLFSTLVWMLIFYYVVNHPRLNKLGHWFLWVLVVVVINFGAAYYIATRGLDDLYFDTTGAIAPYYNEFYTFSLIVASWSAVFAIGWSFVVKWWSVNCSRTPA